MKRLTLIALAALMAACATPAERRKQPPDLDLTSSKPAKDVAICIADKWENTKPLLAFSSPPVNTTMRANGFSITATSINRLGSTSTIALTDVIETPQGCTITFYKQGGGGFGAYDEAVKQCL